MDDRVWLSQNYPELFEFTINTHRLHDINIPWSAIRANATGFESMQRELLQRSECTGTAPCPSIAGPSNWFDVALSALKTDSNCFFQYVACKALLATGEPEMTQHACKVRNMTLAEIFGDEKVAQPVLRALDRFVPDGNLISTTDCLTHKDKPDNTVRETGCDRPRKMARMR